MYCHSNSSENTSDNADMKNSKGIIILARRPDLIIINKKKRICKIIDFAVPADQKINLKESEKKDKYLDLARELKKVEHESRRTGGDYPNDGIAKNGQNPEKSPGDMRRLAVTQTPVKNHQLTLM